MEQSLTLFFKKRFTPRGIFEARQSKLIFIILQLIFASLLLGFPLSIQMYNLDISGFIDMMYPKLSADTAWQEELLTAFQDETAAEIRVGDELIIYSPEDTLPAVDSTTFILFTKTTVNMRYAGIDVYGEYVNDPIETLSQTFSSPAELLAELLDDAKYGFLSMLSLLIYPVVILLNIIFIGALSVMSLSLNYSANVVFRFKEFYAYFCYAATIPALLSLIVGSFTSIAYVYLIYNFILALFAYFVYVRMQRSGKYDESLNGKRHLI